MQVGELPVPYLHELEDRLSFGRGLLNDMLDKLDHRDRPNVQRRCMHNPMVSKDGPIT